MSRTLRFSVVALLCECVLLTAVDPAAGQADGNAAKGQGRQNLQAADMQVDQLSPEMQLILQNWADASSKIEKLQGRHDRLVYDLTFQVELRSKGTFYYESPDKGRIDIEAVEISPGQKSDRIDPKTGERFGLQGDTPETWIADGENILQIDHPNKQATLWKIPEDKQGQNIMNGPLPFLFGMPPDLAKRRFRFELINSNFQAQNSDGSPGPVQIHLKITPRWQSDAANWREADVLLDKSTYLPTAVQLKDPAGTLITVYSFSDLEVNKPRGVFQLFKNPFKYPLAARGYKVQLQDPAGEQQPAMNGGQPQLARTAQGGLAIPNVVGKPHDDATKILESKGFNVIKKQGELTADKKLYWHVQNQIPAAGQAAKPGQDVILVIYDKKATRTSAKPRTDGVRRQ